MGIPIRKAVILMFSTKHSKGSISGKKTSVVVINGPEKYLYKRLNYSIKEELTTQCYSIDLHFHPDIDQTPNIVQDG